MKELGHWSLLELEVGLEGFALALLTRVMGVRTLWILNMGFLKLTTWQWEYIEVQVLLGKGAN
jgi:hypothetical protein